MPAESAFLNDLLAASSIAIVGASDSPNKASGRTQRYLAKYGYSGRVYPVNPSRAQVQGLAAYPSVAALPEVPDLVVIVVPADAVEAAIEDCGKAGVRTVIVFTSGFSELGAEGRALEEQVAATARKHGIRMLGPNCVGVVSAAKGLTAAFMTGLDQDRFTLKDDGIAFVTQSGAMGAFILSMAQSTGLGLGRFVSTGNEADISLPEVLTAMVLDPATRVVLAYVEGIRDADAFVRALELAQERRVPVVMMKVGRSERGSSAAQSHTGAMSGEDSVYDGIMRQYGVHRAHTIDELLDLARIFAAPRQPQGTRTTVLTLSGGAGVLMTDAAEDLGLELTEWTEVWRAKLAEVLPPFASLTNPIDMTGAVASDPGLIAGSLKVCLANPDTDSVVLILGNLDREEEAISAAITEAMAGETKPLIVTWIGGSGRPAELLGPVGVPVFPEPIRAVTSLAVASHWGAGPVERTQEPVAHAAPAAQPTAVVDEAAAKQLLSEYGIPVTRERSVASADEAVQAAAEIGYPVVLKLLSTEVAHKSDLGFVRVGLGSDDEVRESAEWMLAKAAELGVGDRRLTVQEFVRSETELIIGMRRDDVFGPVMLFGIGGVLAEVLGDVQVRRAPLTTDSASELVHSLQFSAMLFGARGRTAVDLTALTEVLVAFSRFAIERGDDFESFEVNPILIRDDGTPVAVDALGIPA